ncbi:MAG: 2-amino-4-hydroxy-6-hydroxymethyldihydropteridine diphosphokinase [Gemmatimonadaceae bacterium]|nr:2-amino-4-hydroxy-6-hydroxymethyldihydropteridine diphosphokinase [Gemmatimonadaceae bacterium]
MTRRPPRAAISLGCNLGDCARTLASARDAIRAIEGIVVLGATADIVTEAIGPGPQGAYLNAMVLVRSTIAPAALLAQLHAIEERHGRQRGVRHAPRTLDLDLVWEEATVSRDRALVLPHPALGVRPWLAEQLTALAGAGVTAQAIRFVEDREWRDPRLPLPEPRLPWDEDMVYSPHPNPAR